MYIQIIFRAKKAGLVHTGKREKIISAHASWLIVTKVYRKQFLLTRIFYARKYHKDGTLCIK